MDWGTFCTNISSYRDTSPALPWPCQHPQGCLGTYAPTVMVASGPQCAQCLPRPLSARPGNSRLSTSGRFPNPREFYMEGQRDWLRWASQRSYPPPPPAL